MRYSLKFFDYWHVSSGLSAGVRVDSSVVKDKNGLPFVSGKTIKGLLRELAEIIDKKKCEECFGKEGISNDGKCIFSNALIAEYKDIIKFNLQKELCDEITTTAIDSKNGVAKTDSLRTMEVVVPLTLEGSIEGCDDKCEESIKAAMSMLKRVGMGRNRGFGRCDMKEKTDE